MAERVKPLSVDDLGVVQEELYAARTHWYNLGLKLGLKPDVLDTIKIQCSGDPSECFQVTLKDYLKTITPWPSWMALVEALRSPIVDQPQLAEKVEKKYCPAFKLHETKYTPPPIHDETLPNPQGIPVPLSSPAEEMSETENWSSLTDSQKIALKAEGVASLPCEDYQSPLEIPKTGPTMAEAPSVPEKALEKLTDQQPTMDRQPPQQHFPKELLYKVLVIGDFSVGKTSIIRRYTTDIFSPNYKLTIGIDFALKILAWDANTKICLQLWDIAGHERFGHMTRVYYKYAIAAIIVFDLSRQITFEKVLKWRADVKQKVMLENGDPVPVLLLANKCDLENPQVDLSMLDSFCVEHDIITWFATSAKEGTNIAEAMEFLVKKILELSSREVEEPQDPDMVDFGRAGGREISGLVDGSNGNGGAFKLNVVPSAEPSLKSKNRCCN